MNVSSPIPAMLGRFLAANAGVPNSPLLLLIKAASGAEATGQVTATAPHRPAYRYLALASLLRVYARAEPRPQALWHATLERQIAAAKATTGHLLTTSEPRPVDLLWHHWILVLVRQCLGDSLPDNQLAQLWALAFAGQSPAGHLHPLGADTLLDGFVYDELCALHAAYNAARALRRPAMLVPLQSMVDWHLNNTQPDHTTTEPWGLAAFTQLDPTGTFAQQQLHDAVTYLERTNISPSPPGPADEATMIVPALLADAVLTLQDLDQADG